MTTLPALHSSLSYSSSTNK